jgi:hypothetical protein
LIKKTITYTDFNGQQQTEDFYFNLTKAELAEMELSGEGNSLKASLERIVASNDGAKIVSEFKKILEKSYGVRSADGKRFMKSPQAWEEFASSEAYSVLFMELATDANASAEFINALVPIKPPQGQPAVPGFRPGHEPTSQPTPPTGAFGQPTQPVIQAPDQSQSAQPIQQYDPSQDRGPQSFPPAPQQ